MIPLVPTRAIFLWFLSIYIFLGGIECSTPEIQLPDQYESWPNLSSSRAVALRSQRDFSTNISIASNVVMGVNLTTVVFEHDGYNSSALQSIRTLLNVGVQALAIDLYYNEFTKDWSLCPLDSTNVNSSSSQRCSEVSDFNLTSVVNTIDTFISGTDTVLSTNVLYILLRINPIVYRNSVHLSGIHHLGNQFRGIRELVTPESMNPLSLPTVHQLLFNSDLRVITTIVEDNLLPNTTYNISSDMNTLFVGSSVINSTTFKFNNTLPLIYEPVSKFDDQTASEVDETTFTFTHEIEDDYFTVESYRDIILHGFSPIISRNFNNLSDISTFLDNSFWSWAPGEPISGNTTASSSSNGKIENVLNDRCVIITKQGWKSVPCNDKYHSVCTDGKPGNFILTKSLSDYTTSNENCYSLGKKYSVAVPVNAVQQHKLMGMIPTSELGLWIDVNSLSSSNCWVQGLNSVCPYQKTISTRIFVRMLGIGGFIAFLLLVLLISLQFSKMPVHQNRHHWKKLMQNKLANQYEGVPA